MAYKMKKLILYILFILAFLMSINSIAQTTSVHQGWKCENNGNWNSFYWNVKRTLNPDAAGYYYYDVYFYSNSYLNTDIDLDGKYDKAIVYITNLTVTMYEYKNAYLYSTVDVVIPYILVDWANKKAAYFYSYSPSCKFVIKYASASPYNYSTILNK